MRTLLTVGLVAAGFLSGGCHHVLHHALWHHHHGVVHHSRPAVVVRSEPVRVVTPKKKVLLPHEILAQRHKEHMRWLRGDDD